MYRLNVKLFSCLFGLALSLAVFFTFCFWLPGIEAIVRALVLAWSGIIILFFACALASEFTLKEILFLLNEWRASDKFLSHIAIATITGLLCWLLLL